MSRIEGRYGLPFGQRLPVGGKSADLIAEPPVELIAKALQAGC